MTSSGCRQMGALVGPYVDGELSGADRLRMAHHLEVCAACADGVADAAGLGDLIRQVAGDGPVSRFEGLASGVVEQVRAELAVSWSARFDRATGDSRLLWVGAGSVLGAVATTMIVALSLVFNLPAASPDSLSALLSGTAPEGTLMVIARPHDGQRGAILLEYGSPGPRVLTEGMLTEPSEQELVDALAQAVTRRGRVVWLTEMSATDRQNVEKLFAELQRRRTKDVVPVEVEQVRFVTSTDVTAKGL